MDSSHSLAEGRPWLTGRRTEQDSTHAWKTSPGSEFQADPEEQDMAEAGIRAWHLQRKKRE
ncbi:hypothetical protein O9K51_02839 [Purpureocillium lavendulum]|uniref:Uncharacterized protein n=1 Tax=Purpureocillium lavendulum TaxID=1247861 RepID=A0AB34FYL5_9HYPO|nr:hypothetical protein O9K51_02839 [Purpureocillium lavendulum]